MSPAKADTARDCAAACVAEPLCVAFWAVVAGSSVGDCCLIAGFNDNTFFNLDNGEFYSMSQCSTCKPGYFKRGRRCMPLSVPPVVQGGTGSRTLLIPLNTQAGSVLDTFVALPDAGFGPLMLTLAPVNADAVLPLALANETGTLSLKTQLGAPGSIEAIVSISDTRTECTRLNSEGIAVTRAGPCTTVISVAVQTAVFLNCPSNINAYLPPSASEAALTWTEPSLPTFLSDLNVTRSLGDTFSTSAPFNYSVGTRRVTYTTQPLTVGGSLVCDFDVTVQYGLSISVESIARKVSSKTVQEFLVVDPSVADEGARLPSFTGAVTGNTFGVGLLAPAAKPFTVSPQVRAHVLKMVRAIEGALREDKIKMADKI